MATAERAAVSHILGLLAATGAPPGSDMPKASAMMCMVLAVPMPVHTPGPAIARSLMVQRSSTVIPPVATCPAWMNTSSMSAGSPLSSTPQGW